jgi:hypothetical protein
MTTDDVRSGHLSWESWCFDYLVSHTEGLALLNGYHDGRKVFKKLSLPVIRVKYVKDGSGSHASPGGCGPYADHVQWITAESLRGRRSESAGAPHHLVRIKRCHNKYIGISTFEIRSDEGDSRWLELGVYARIGEYHIYQVYYLSDRLLCPRVFSRGLQCNLEHVHHAYWRFDLDVDGDAPQRVLVVRDGFAGYFDLEGAYRMDGDLTTRWAVENLRTKSRVWIFPDDTSPGEPVAGTDAFCMLDANIRKYRPGEDIAWPFHTGEIDFRPQGNPDGTDVVFWLVSHLRHIPEDDTDPWHAVGPTLLVEPAVASELQPREALRTVTVEVEIAIKRSAALAADTERRFAFAQTAALDRDHAHAEIAYQTEPVSATTRAAVLATLTWNPDGSVGVDCSATLYLRTDSADTETHHVNVLRDHGEELNIHLASGGLVPDRAHVRLTLTNRPRGALAVLPHEP